MAVLADYQPPGKPGYAVDSFIQGLDAGQSFVERKQMMRLREQRADQEKMEFIAKLPLIQAHAKSEQVSAAAAVANATRMEQLRSQAASVSTAYNDEFLAAMQFDTRVNVEASDETPESEADQTAAGEFATQETLDGRAEKLSALNAKIGWMELIPEYKGFVSTVKKQAAEAHESAFQNRKLKEYRAIAEKRIEGTLAGTEMRVEGAERVAETQAEGRKDAATARASYEAQRIIELENAADDAETDDPELAAKLRARITRLTAPPATKTRRALPPAVAAKLGVPATVATPEGEKPIPPGTKTVKVEGKDYPLAVDKQGNRAYYKDGKWIELPAGR